MSEKTLKFDNVRVNKKGFQKSKQRTNLVLNTLRCAAPVCFKGHHATPLVIRYFPPNPYLGNQRISLEVSIILSICL